MIEQRSIPIAAGDFDAIAAGPPDGRPVLLLHGFPEAGIAWEHQVAALGRHGYRVVAPDQRGYSPGVRPKRTGDYDMSELVADVLAIADALEWNRVDLAGHDCGAGVAWSVAEQHPERVRTLTAVSMPHPAALADAQQGDEDQALRSAYLSEWRQIRTTERRMLDNDADVLRRMFEWKVPPSRVEEYVRRLSEPGALTAALSWYRDNRPSARIGPVSVPTLYVWSTEDVAYGSTAALDTDNWVTGPYYFHMLEDVTHWVPEEAPAALSSLLLEFLNAH
jgi:pimeloyl-ACP methyl ester carboxylesterase